MFSNLFKKKTQKNEKIRVISASVTGNSFVVGEWEKNIQIWELNGHIVQTLQTDLDTGNGESISISNDGRQLLIAGCDNNTVTLFDVQTKSIIWKRTDIKKPYKVKILDHEKNQVFIDTENKGCYLLSRNSGETIEKLQGVRDIKESPYSNLNQLEKLYSSSIVIRETKEKMFSFKHKEDLLDSIFTEDLLVCSYVSGPIEGLDLESKEIIWSTFGKGHFLRVGYNSKINKIIAVRWNAEKGGSKYLCYLNLETGRVEKEIDLEEPIVVEFIKNGEYIITSQGKLYSTNDGLVIKEFEFENN